MEAARRADRQASGLFLSATSNLEGGSSPLAIPHSPSSRDCKADSGVAKCVGVCSGGSTDRLGLIILHVGTVDATDAGGGGSQYHYMHFILSSSLSSGPGGGPHAPS